MSTVTAQFLIGSSHPNDGGIIPHYCLYLHENSRPALLLEEKGGSKEWRWILTLEHMLDDAMLMIAVHVLKDEAIIQKLGRYAPHYLEKENNEALELYESLNADQRQRLYALTKETINKKYGGLKVVISIFQESSLRSQIPLLKSYEIDMEVCVSIYSRFFSSWREEVVVSGSLDIRWVK